MKRTHLLFPFVAATAVLSLAQTAHQPQPPPPVISPEVRSDRRVTFRFRAPNAKEVSRVREGAERLPLQKNPEGVWSITTDALEPDFYGYAFVADGVGRLQSRQTERPSAAPASVGVTSSVIPLSNFWHVERP